MTTRQVILRGTVRNGVVVPATETTLPEGAEVEIRLNLSDVPPELQAEFAAWEALSDEAWGMIDSWEKEQP
jgi:hypothetical protein